MQPTTVMNGIGARRLHAPSSPLPGGGSGRNEGPVQAAPEPPNSQSFRNSLGVRWGGSASSTSISSSGGRAPSHQVGMEG